MQEETMLWRKRRQTQTQDSQPRQNCWKQMQGQKLCREKLKQNLRKAIIYDNKPRPAARGNSQTIASEGCKKINKLVLQVYN